MMIYLNDINESGDGAECIHVVQKLLEIDSGHGLKRILSIMKL